MSHRAVRTLIKDVVKSLTDEVQFGYGRQSEFNMLQNKRPKIAWLLPLTSNPSFSVNSTDTYVEAWNCQLMFMEFDTAGGDEKDSEKILDEVDLLVTKFIHRLNDFYMTSDDIVGSLTLRGFTKTPFYKDNSDIQTGWLLSFQMVVSDQFDYCTPDNQKLYAGTLRGHQ